MVSSVNIAGEDELMTVMMVRAVVVEEDEEEELQNQV